MVFSAAGQQAQITGLRIFRQTRPPPGVSRRFARRQIALVPGLQLPAPLLAAPQTAHIRKATSIVVAKQLVNFKKELFFPGSVRVGARVSRVGRSSLDFECTLLADNVEVATAETYSFRPS